MKELKSLKEEGNPPDFKLESDIFTTIIYRSEKARSLKPGKNGDDAKLTARTGEGVKYFLKQHEQSLCRGLFKTI